MRLRLLLAFATAVLSCREKPVVVPWTDVIDALVRSNRTLAPCSNVSTYASNAWDPKTERIKEGARPLEHSEIRADAGSPLCFSVQIVALGSTGNRYRIYINWMSNTNWSYGGARMLELDCSNAGCRTRKTEWNEILN